MTFYNLNTDTPTGTAAFAAFGCLVSLGLLAWFHLFALLPALTSAVIARVVFISVACALVELVRMCASPVCSSLSMFGEEGLGGCGFD